MHRSVSHAAREAPDGGRAGIGAPFGSSPSAPSRRRERRLGDADASSPGPDGIRSVTPLRRDRAERSAQYPSANFASSLIMSGDHGGVKTILGWTAETPSSSPTYSFIWSET